MHYIHTIYIYTWQIHIILHLIQPFSLPSQPPQWGKIRVLTWFWDYHNVCSTTQRVRSCLRSSCVEKWASSFHPFQTPQPWSSQALSSFVDSPSTTSNYLCPKGKKNEGTVSLLLMLFHSQQRKLAKTIVFTGFSTWEGARSKDTEDVRGSSKTHTSAMPLTSLVVLSAQSSFSSRTSSGLDTTSSEDTQSSSTARRGFL